MNWSKPLFQITMTPVRVAGYSLAVFLTVATTAAITFRVTPKVAHADRALQFHGQRYEVIHSSECMDTKKYPQYKDEENENCFGGYPYVRVWDIERFHDLMAGTDFICAHKDSAISCFQVVDPSRQKAR